MKLKLKIEGVSMDKVYKCIKEFVLDKYEDDEQLENEQFIVPVDSTWELSEYAHMSDIRLESELGWIEIDSDSFRTLFIKCDDHVTHKWIGNTITASDLYTQ